jgi:hypothetical protein
MNELVIILFATTLMFAFLFIKSLHNLAQQDRLIEEKDRTIFSLKEVITLLKS